MCEKLTTKKLTIEKFINKANKKHNNKFNYSKVNYKNNKTKITIICPIHGDFDQHPDDHLKGIGCSKCSGNNKKTKNEFIVDAIKKHGNKYDYSLVNYININTKVKIICPKHSVFEQTPDHHSRDTRNIFPKNRCV